MNEIVENEIQNIRRNTRKMIVMENGIQKCNQCGRGCSVDNLRCNRGRMFFDNLKKQQEENVITNQQESDVEVKTGEVAIEENDSGRIYSMVDNMNEENELLSMLEKCGCFLHHKHGGKRGQVKILKILAENPNINQKELQDILGIKSGSISEIAIKLETKGFIKRIKDKEDKRLTKLEITEYGLEHLNGINKREVEVDSKLFQSLSSDEQETMKVLLTKLIADWNESYDMKNRAKGHHKEKGHRGKCGQNISQGCHNDREQHHHHAHKYDHKHEHKHKHDHKHKHGRDVNQE